MKIRTTSPLHVFVVVAGTLSLLLSLTNIPRRLQDVVEVVLSLAVIFANLWYTTKKAGRRPEQKGVGPRQVYPPNHRKRAKYHLLAAPADKLPNIVVFT